jgi:Skp family chaperone for outer membrane proteins
MITAKNILVAAALAVPAIIATAVPAQAQVAVASPEGAIAATTAWKAAAAQLQTTYATQIAQARTRSQAIQAEMAPMIQAFDTARKAPNANEATLRTQYAAIQAKEAAGNQEIQTLTAPYQRAQAYALEQLGAQMQPAVAAAAAKKKVAVVLRPNEVMFLAPASDITTDVTTELNRLIPTVSITPPANWQPGQQGQGAAPAPAPARPAPATPPQGR